MNTIPTADLGASRDVLPSDTDIASKVVLMSPKLLMAACKSTGGDATVRLVRYEPGLGWIPSAVPSVVIDGDTDAGLAELRWNCGEIGGHYGLEQTAGAGTVTFKFLVGQG